MKYTTLLKTVGALVAPILLVTACSGHTGGTSSNLIPQNAQRHQVPMSIQVHANNPNLRSKMTSGGPNVLADPGFESGGFNAGWYSCGKVAATIATDQRHTGNYAARMGSASSSSGSIYGDAGVCQSVTIPQTGQLSFWVYQASNEPDASYAWQEADLLDSTGAVVQNLYKEVSKTQQWTLRTYDVSRYVGRTLTLYFGVHGDGWIGTYTYQYVDDVSLAAATPPVKPVNVGAVGNEPIVTEAPDGTLYISALQHFYRSSDSGNTWTNLPGPPEASTLNLNSDSSIAVDPGGRVYFTFDYPYAGTTAVCTSDDRGDTWNCNPAVVPGGTDRMWITAPTVTDAFETTNEGLYQTAFLDSSDRGQTWTPYQLGSGITQPQTGPLLEQSAGSYILQPVNMNNYVFLYRYLPVQTTQLTNETKPVGIPAPAALPSMALTTDGTLYAVSEGKNARGGKQIVLATSSDMGASFHPMPAIPATSTGTAVFTAITGGSPGHLGVIYYYTTDNGDPSTLTASSWSAMYAETYNANSAAPTWAIRTLDTGIHTGAICAALSCAGNARFSGDFITASIDSNDDANLTWVKDLGTSTTIRFARIPRR